MQSKRCLPRPSSSSFSFFLSRNPPNQAPQPAPSFSVPPCHRFMIIADGIRCKACFSPPPLLFLSLRKNIAGKLTNSPLVLFSTVFYLVKRIRRQTSALFPKKGFLHSPFFSLQMDGAKTAYFLFPLLGAHKEEGDALSRTLRTVNRLVKDTVRHQDSLFLSFSLM